MVAGVNSDIEASINTMGGHIDIMGEHKQHGRASATWVGVETIL